jgi:hypothetical protein
MFDYHVIYVIHVDYVTWRVYEVCHRRSAAKCDR